jgi:hypothetical protein
MNRDKMKVIGTILGAVLLSLSLVAGFLAVSGAGVAFAADQSSKPSVNTPQLGDRVAGWCNWDGDQDQDDWCWSTTTTTTVPGGNGYAAPGGNGSTVPAGTVVPYGSIVGQTDPAQDAGYMSGYNNNGYNNNRYNNFYIFPRTYRFRRFLNDGDGDADDVLPPTLLPAHRYFLGRNGSFFLFNGRRVFLMP